MKHLVCTWLLRERVFEWNVFWGVASSTGSLDVNPNVLSSLGYFRSVDL